MGLLSHLCNWADMTAGEKEEGKEQAASGRALGGPVPALHSAVPALPPLSGNAQILTPLNMEVLSFVVSCSDLLLTFSFSFLFFLFSSLSSLKQTVWVA